MSRAAEGIWRNVPTLSPLRFLERAARNFESRTAVEDDGITRTYGELAVRSEQLAAALGSRGHPGDRVGALASNSSTLVELHFGVPLARQQLVALNTRLSAPEVRYILGHARVRMLIATREHVQLARDATEGAGIDVIVADDESGQYEQLLATTPTPRTAGPAAEHDAITINYTSGTTAVPKGVVYSHRGAFLQSAAVAYHAGLDTSSRYLWTLPMFHCNGWCFTWAGVAAGATHVCLRSVEPARIWEILRTGGASHFCGAPTVLNMIAHSQYAVPLTRRVRAMVGGAPPAPADLRAAQSLGIDVSHLYGLTETYGPVVANVWQPEWNSLPDDVRADLSARQGIPNIMSSVITVVDSAGSEVPADGETLGEISIEGESVASGYLLAGAGDGVGAFVPIEQPFRTGDLAVRHPDGYIEIRDRAKDLVVTGGENVASVQVEQVLTSHPLVDEAAVVGAPDPHWGQVVVAFVRSAPNAVSESDLIDFAREKMARYKVPKLIVFADIPRNSTGKVQKHQLRQRAAEAWEERRAQAADAVPTLSPRR